MTKTKWTNSIVYKTALSFSLMSLVTLWLLSGISYVFLSSQYTRNIKASLITQYQSLYDEIKNDGTNATLEDQVPTLTNEGFLVFVHNKKQNFLYRNQTIPFLSGSFYTAESGSGDILFYMNTIKGQEMFLGKKMDDFEKTTADYIEILLIINITFLIILILLSFILSRKILQPITKLSNYLRGYRFNNDDPKILYEEGQFFEIDILTKAFDTALQYTQQTIQKEKEFLQDASHELRTPLMGISSSIELLQEISLNPAQKKKVDIIQLLVNKLQKITNELLFLTRGDKQSTTMETIQLGSYIQTIIDGYETNIETKNLKIISHLDSGVSISAAEIDMQKLFSNLIDNAIKYTPVGGKITISLSQNSFEIKDTGIGMSSAFIGRLGDRFIREDHAKDFNYEGVGLGLSIVYKIIQEYKRSINILSKPLLGTRIKVFFLSDFDKK